MEARSTAPAAHSSCRGRSEECRACIESLKASGVDVAMSAITRYDDFVTIRKMVNESDSKCREVLNGVEQRNFRSNS